MSCHASIQTGSLKQVRLCLLQASLLLFCDRFNSARNFEPAVPQVKYVTLTGTAPQWAVAADAQAIDPLVFFELEVIFADPVADLRANNLAIEAGTASCGMHLPFLVAAAAI